MAPQSQRLLLCVLKYKYWVRYLNSSFGALVRATYQKPPIHLTSCRLCVCRFHLTEAWEKRVNPIHHRIFRSKNFTSDDHGGLLKNPARVNCTADGIGDLEICSCVTAHISVEVRRGRKVVTLALKRVFLVSIAMRHWEFCQRIHVQNEWNMRLRSFRRTSSWCSIHIIFFNYVALSLA